jgi:hypothetical protein
MIWSSAGCTFTVKSPPNHQQLESVILTHNNVVAIAAGPQVAVTNSDTVSTPYSVHVFAVYTHNETPSVCHRLCAAAVPFGFPGGSIRSHKGRTSFIDAPFANTRNTGEVPVGVAGFADLA